MTLSVKAPSSDQIQDLAAGFGMTLDRPTAETLRTVMAATLASYARVDELVAPSLPVRHPRTPGWRPTAEDNPLNAWYWRCAIEGAPTGVLQGKPVAIKDNICVAGVPMANGSRVLEGYVPDVDATVVTRILEAGRHDRRQSRLRGPVLLGRQPHLRHRPDPQPVGAGLLGRRLVGRQRGAGRLRRRRDGAGRRSGRLDPHAVRLVRRLWPQADLGPRALHGRHADRLRARPPGPDLLEPREHGAPPDRDRRPRPARPAHRFFRAGRLHGRARARRRGVAHRHPQGRLRACGEQRGDERQGAKGARRAGGPGRRAQRGLGADAPRRAARLDRDHPRRRDRADDQGQRPGQQLERLLHGLA